MDAFQDDLKDDLKDHPAELTRGVPEMIEVLPHGASKAAGLRALLEELGVSPDEVRRGEKGGERRKGEGSLLGQVFRKHTSSFPCLDRLFFFIKSVRTRVCMEIGNCFWFWL